MKPSELIVELARMEIDTQELPVNKTKYGKWYGMNGQPWCAMYVSWVFNEAGLVRLVAASSKKGFASCDAGLKWFAKKGQLIPVGDAEPGDLVFFQFDEDAQPDHVGIVSKNLKKRKSLMVLEGNTSSGNSGSQSSGDGVYERKRSYSTVMAVARPKYKAEVKTYKSADEVIASLKK